MGRGDNPRIDSWASLRKGAGSARAKIGVLNGSVAEAYARTYCGQRANVVAYDGNTDTMREVETGKLDATIEDTPLPHFTHRGLGPCAGSKIRFSVATTSSTLAKERPPPAALTKPSCYGAQRRHRAIYRKYGIFFLGRANSGACRYRRERALLRVLQGYRRQDRKETGCRRRSPSRPTPASTAGR